MHSAASLIISASGKMGLQHRLMSALSEKRTFSALIQSGIYLLHFGPVRQVLYLTVYVLRAADLNTGCDQAGSENEDQANHCLYSESDVMINQHTHDDR